VTPESAKTQSWVTKTVAANSRSTAYCIVSHLLSVEVFLSCLHKLINKNTQDGERFSFWPPS